MKKIAFLAGLTCALQAQVPLPKITPLPVTADSRPFLGAANNLQPIDLSKYGFVEEEFLMSGSANVYDWAADGSLKVRTSGAPYTTRILVRRPATQAKFSGAVYVELMNAARRMDWSMMWGYSHDHFLQRGDAWIGISLPAALPGLLKFNPKRYAGVSFANPSTTACPGDTKGPSADEPGLLYDALSQVAASVKSSTGPMGPLKAGAVYLTSQGVDIAAYVDAIQGTANVAGGKSAYDGFVVKNPTAPNKLNLCGAQLAQDDPRRKLKSVGVPVIGVVAQGELGASLWARRSDSDDPGGRYRQYEVAAASHIDKYPYTALASFADQAAAGTAQGTPDFPFAAPCTPPIPMQDSKLMTYIFDVAYQQIDEWARKGKAPPKSGTLDMGKLNDFGIAPGGIRSPFSDVPAATYTMTSPGPATCAEMGSTNPFDDAKLTSMYGSRKQYEAKYAAAADAMLKARFITEADAKELKGHPKP